MSANRKYLVWLAAAVGGAVLVALLLVPSGTWVALDVRRSSLRTTPDGIAAWARSLERLGVPTATRYVSFTAEPPIGPMGGGLVLLEPIQPPSAAEIGVTLTWVREGGFLVYSPALGGLILDSLGLSVSRRTLGPAGDGPPRRSRLLDHPWTAGVQRDTLLATWALEADSVRSSTWTPLAVLDDSSTVTLAWVPEGSGGVLVAAEGAPLSNGRLGTSALGAVVTRALVDLLGPGDTLVFSEYHQALGGRRGVFRESYALAAASPVGRVLLQAGAVAALLLLLSSRRFGAPAPEPERDRRSPLEHVEALGHIYRGSSSDGAVARKLVQGAVRRSGRRPARAETEADILEAWAGRPEVAAAAGRAIAAMKREPPDLVGLSAALDAVVTEYAPQHSES